MADANPALDSTSTYAAQLDAELKSGEQALKDHAVAGVQLAKNLAETKARSLSAHVASDAMKLAAGVIKAPSKAAEYAAVGAIVLLATGALYVGGHYAFGWPL